MNKINENSNAASLTALDLESNERARVSGFQGPSVAMERLKEMGLVLGVEIEACGAAPFGGPRLYRLGATVIALRKEEATCLKIQK